MIGTIVLLASQAARRADELAMREPALFELETSLEPNELEACLSRNYSGLMNLQSADSPPGSKAIRLRNSAAHVVVEISRRYGGGSVMEVYVEEGHEFSRQRVLALQSCIPELGLPAAADPRNRDFYRGQ